MFHRPIAPNGRMCLPAPALDPDPAAKWVRFVFNSLLQNDQSGKEVRVHFQELPAGTVQVFPDICGFATFRVGFFTASARAIELAGLLPPNAVAHANQAPVDPNPPKPPEDQIDKLSIPLRSALDQFVKATTALKPEHGDSPTLQSCFDWCRSEGMAVGKFGTWRKNVRRARKALGFPPLNAKPGFAPRSAVPAKRLS